MQSPGDEKRGKEVAGAFDPCDELRMFEKDGFCLGDEEISDLTAHQGGRRSDKDGRGSEIFGKNNEVDVL